jgi:hypothetical protein
LVLLSVVLLVTAVVLPHEASAQRKFSFAYDQPHTTAYGIAADIFQAKLKELSGGKLDINQFPGAQLGQEPVVLQKLRSGDIEFAITSTANASTVAPSLCRLNFSLFFDTRRRTCSGTYSAQLAVDAESQGIVAENVTPAVTDVQALPRLVAEIKANTGRQGREVSADAGYCSTANLQVLQRRHIRAYIAVGRQRHGQRARRSARAAAGPGPPADPNHVPRVSHCDRHFDPQARVVGHAHGDRLL